MAEQVTIEGRPIEGLAMAICVDPRIRSVKDGDNIECTFYYSGGPGPAKIDRIVGVGTALPPSLSSATFREVVGPVPHLGKTQIPPVLTKETRQYQIELLVEGQKVKLDPDYRVRP